MFRFTLLALLLIVAATQVQTGHKEETVFSWCRRGVRPKEQGKNHNRFKRQCAKQLGIDLTDPDQRTKEWSICSITPYGWYDEENDAFDTEAFRKIVTGYVTYSDLTDLQKEAIGNAWDDCLTEKSIEKMRWGEIMSCLSFACQEADDRIPKTIDQMGGYWD